MKKVFFALIGFAFLLSGCIKESSEEQEVDTDYFVRFKADGKQMEYREFVLATRSTGSGVFAVEMQGRAALTGNPEGIQIVVADSVPVVAKAYREADFDDAIVMVFNNSTGDEFSSLFTTSASGLQVTLQNINEETVRGTFSGRIADLSGKQINITEGALYVKFQ